MPSLFDTIVAPITGPPPAAVAWVRVSGPEAWRIGAEVFSPWPNEPTPRTVLYGRYATGDDGLAIPFEAAHSYTGEDAVELSMHGSRASIHSAVEACLAAGARLAEPGEFTQRAFLNGRIDLSQAEGVRESCEAFTAAQLRLASRLREGVISQEVIRIREDLIRLLSGIEASVDFSEEIGDLDRVQAAEVCNRLLFSIDRLLMNAESGRILREGFRIAIVGPPNAGKSSLLNALLGAERAIVTDTPGTTRDYIEEQADFGGVPVVLIDTAGLRESDDAVESIGVQRSRTVASQADLVWYVYDGSIGTVTEDEVAAFDRPVRLVANKADLGTSGPGLPVSALTGDGLAGLVQEVREQVDLDVAVPLINRRHETILLTARDTLETFEHALENEGADDLLSVLLSQTIIQLGEITGETAAPDMVERIFHDFCIGK
jgi:tRNA modification GTPase